jgi:hypothetical protein
MGAAIKIIIYSVLLRNYFHGGINYYMVILASGAPAKVMCLGPSVFSYIFFTHVQHELVDISTTNPTIGPSFLAPRQAAFPSRPER